MHRSALVVLGLLAVSACQVKEQQRANPLASRAAFELSCPAPSLRYVQLSEKTWGVIGCGRRATYLYRCDPVYMNGIPIGDGSNCVWVMNGPLLQYEAPATPAATATPSSSAQ